MSARIWSDKETTTAASTLTARRVMIALTALLLLAAALVTAWSAADLAPTRALATTVNKTSLDNVRDFAPALTPDGLSYAVDGGTLYAGRPLDWQRVSVPDGVIVGAVALDANNPQNLYIGAADELALYRSSDGGENWLYVPLSTEAIGGVKDIAFDSHNRLLYVGTDTAGLFRLRDVGSSITDGGHFAVDEPIVEVATDSMSFGMAFFRTENALYRSENGGLGWIPVETLTSVPTALAVANTLPPTVYVGTMDRGLLRSDKGDVWMTANSGLNWVPGSRLRIDALAVDPQQPEVLYASTSYLYGSTTVHESPSGVWMSANASSEWAPVVHSTAAVVDDLMPVPGVTGAVYATSAQSRTPLALGIAPVASKVSAPAEATGPLAWAGFWMGLGVAVVAAAWLALLLVVELRKPVAAAQPARIRVRSS
jgi:hypothetical protein